MQRRSRSFFFLSLFCIAAAGPHTLPAPYCEMDQIYSFDSFGWFNKQKQRVLKRLIKGRKTQVVVELGSFLGQSTRFIAEQLSSGGKVYAVDHWKGSQEHQDVQRTDIYPKLENLYERFLSNVIHANLCDKIIPVKATTLDAVKIIEQTPDLVFVDASHQYEDVLADLTAWYPKVAKEGVLCGDDWQWGEDLPVQRAVIDFASQKGVKYFSEGAIWWIYKGA